MQKATDPEYSCTATIHAAFQMRVSPENTVLIAIIIMELCLTQDCLHDQRQQ